VFPPLSPTIEAPEYSPDPIAPAPLPSVYEPPQEVESQPVNRRRRGPVERRKLEIRETPRDPVPEPLVDQPPPLQIAASTRFEQPRKSIEPEPLLAEATMEPDKGSTLRRAVGAIPGLGFLKKKPKTDDAYTAAKAIRQVRPRSPGFVTKPAPVRVKVLVDESGKVVRVELLNRSVDPRLADLALGAARNWRFKPAIRDEKEVESEVVLEFRFGPNSTGG
jgi:periplasmic protein TonB